MAPGPPKTRAAAEQRSHLAAVREGLVRRLAVAADEDLKLHAHILEAHAVLVRARSAPLVLRLAPQLIEVFHVILRVWTGMRCQDAGQGGRARGGSAARLHSHLTFLPILAPPGFGLRVGHTMRAPRRLRRARGLRAKLGERAPPGPPASLATPGCPLQTQSHTSHLSCVRTPCGALTVFDKFTPRT